MWVFLDDRFTALPHPGIDVLFSDAIDARMRTSELASSLSSPDCFIMRFSASPLFLCRRHARFAFLCRQNCLWSIVAFYLPSLSFPRVKNKTEKRQTEPKTRGQKRLLIFCLSMQFFGRHPEFWVGAHFSLYKSLPLESV